MNDEQLNDEQMNDEQMNDEQMNDEQLNDGQMSDEQMNDEQLNDEQMSDEQLQQWVEHISLESFGRPFVHKATFNDRLRTTGGRYFMTSHHIEISRKQYETFGREEVEKIIKHELCHYHLHILGRGYRHRDAEFKALLRQVGGSRYCQAIPDQRRKRKPLPYRYKLVCKGCGKEYLRKRRVDTKKYACGVCRGRLRMTELEVAGG